MNRRDLLKTAVLSPLGTCVPAVIALPIQDKSVAKAQEPVEFALLGADKSEIAYPSYRRKPLEMEERPDGGFSIKAPGGVKFSPALGEMWSVHGTAVYLWGKRIYERFEQDVHFAFPNDLVLIASYH